MEFDYVMWENSEWDEKEYIISKIAKNRQYHVIAEIMERGDTEMRSEVISLLIEYTNIPEIEKIVLGAVNDKDWIVRSDAYDILRYSKLPQTLDRLIERIPKEGSHTARSYLISAIGTICRNNEESAKRMDVPKIIELYKKETSAPVLIAYDVLLYVLTKDTDYIRDSLKYLEHKDYRVRCCVINLLEEGTDENTCEMIYKAYSDRLLAEDAGAVQFSLTDAIKMLKEEFDI